MKVQIYDESGFIIGNQEEVQMKQNHEWYLQFQGKRYEIQYRIYHLVGKSSGEEITLHEIEYEGRIITKSRLEEAVKQIGKILRKRK